MDVHYDAKSKVKIVICFVKSYENERDFGNSLFSALHWPKICCRQSTPINYKTHANKLKDSRQ